jgi:phosphatidylethanolamine N-methyltransferase
MTYVSFSMLCLKLYALPTDWTYGMTLLRHTMGLVSIKEKERKKKVTQNIK